MCVCFVCMCCNVCVGCVQKNKYDGGMMMMVVVCVAVEEGRQRGLGNGCSD